jgi:excisionase family DNA binding protein
MPAKNQKKRRTRVTLTRTSEVLDVKMAAELLTVSPDTVYDLFKRGELPGRKVGRKWKMVKWIPKSRPKIAQKEVKKSPVLSPAG